MNYFSCIISRTVIIYNKFIKIIKSNIALSDEKEKDAPEIDIKEQKSIIEFGSSNSRNTSSKSNSFSKPGYHIGQSSYKRK